MGHLEDGVHSRRGPTARIRFVPARCTGLVWDEIKKAKLRFDLPADAPVLSCYEAGRDGFWIHRALVHEGILNIVVDSASIEVSRHKRPNPIVSMPSSWYRCSFAGTTARRRYGAWSTFLPLLMKIARQLHRELIELKVERTELVNRIKGLLAGLGLSVVVNSKLPVWLEKLRQWDKTDVPPALKARILREFERWELVGRQIGELEAQRRREIRTDKSPQGEQTRRLIQLKGIGSNGAWLLVRELRLAKDPQPPRAGELRRADTNALRQWKQPARARHQQGWQPTGAVDDDPVGMGLVAPPAA